MVWRALATSRNGRSPGRLLGTAGSQAACTRAAFDFTNGNAVVRAQMRALSYAACCSRQTTCAHPLPAPNCKPPGYMSRGLAVASLPQGRLSESHAKTVHRKLILASPKTRQRNRERVVVVSTGFTNVAGNQTWTSVATMFTAVRSKMTEVKARARPEAFFFLQLPSDGTAVFPGFTNQIQIVIFIKTRTG